MRESTSKKNITDHAPHEICKNIINLKNTSVCHQLHTFYSKTGKEADLGTPKKASCLFHMPRTYKTIRNEQQNIFDDVSIVPDIDTPSRKQFQIHAFTGSILSGEKGDCQNNHHIHIETHSRPHRHFLFSPDGSPCVHQYTEQEYYSPCRNSIWCKMQHLYNIFDNIF